MFKFAPSALVAILRRVLHWRRELGGMLILLASSQPMKGMWGVVVLLLPIALGHARGRLWLEVVVGAALIVCLEYILILRGGTWWENSLRRGMGLPHSLKGEGIGGWFQSLTHWLIVSRSLFLCRSLLTFKCVLLSCSHERQLNYFWIRLLSFLAFLHLCQRVILKFL
jgi:hypothetical protein